jgi:cell division transport system ATP-binding protein
VLREERPTRGKVFVAGRDLSNLSSWKVPSLRRQIGVVFQDFRLLPNKTVFENVAFALQVIGKPRHTIKVTVPEVLDLVGLGGKEKRRPHELSGGEQQRVAIARAFVNRPSILLADEPTGNLDPTTSLGIMRLLDRINRTGTTVVMATHDEEIVNQMRKRVIELSTGELVRDQTQGIYGARLAAGEEGGLDTGTMPIIREPLATSLPTTAQAAITRPAMAAPLVTTEPPTAEPTAEAPAADPLPADAASSTTAPRDVVERRAARAAVLRTAATRTTRPGARPEIRPAQPTAHPDAAPTGER